MSRITKISQDSSNQTFDFGATFDNVIYEWKENNTTKFFTLKTLYEYLKNFFNKGTFVMYSKNEPKNLNVKIWYKTN